jgi:TatD-related deoxyribonuclease
MDRATPVLDNHLHLDPERGRGLAAVDDFVRLGGTHLLVVNKPSWHLGVESVEPAAFRPVFETTIEIVERASERLPGRAWAVLGAHPGLISRLVEDRGCTPREAREVMTGVLDVAAEYVADGRALALKSGRPHYEVSEAVRAASNAVMRHAFELGAERDCAVQLHTEASEDLTELADWAESRGLSAHRVVKHYASGRLAGPTPSVMCRREWLETTAEAVETAQANPGSDAGEADAGGDGSLAGPLFCMETDFIDDPDRPGAVMGPKTVPRRVRWLREAGYDAAIERAHVETPRVVYGIDTRATLDDE